MDRAAHFAALRAEAQKHPALSASTHDGDFPTKDGQIVRGSYVILYDLGFDEINDDRTTSEQSPDSDGTYRVVARSVGITPFAARSVDDALHAQLVGKRLAIDGRACSAIEQDDTGPVQTAGDVSPPLHFIDTDYTFRSSRA